FACFRRRSAGTVARLDALIVRVACMEGVLATAAVREAATAIGREAAFGLELGAGERLLPAIVETATTIGHFPTRSLAAEELVRERRAIGRLEVLTIRDAGCKVEDHVGEDLLLAGQRARAMLREASDPARAEGNVEA